MSYRNRRNHRGTALASGRPPSVYRRRPPRPPRPDPLEPWLSRVGQDPLFSLTTRSGERWIDPFTGVGVPITGDLESTARAHWRAATSDPPQHPLPAAELEVDRWREDLIEQLPHDRRLRMFGPGATGWLNPFSGDFRAEIQRRDGLMTQSSVAAMARVLAGEFGLGAGPIRSQAELDEILRARQSDGTDELPEIVDEPPTARALVATTIRTATSPPRKVATPLPEPAERPERASSELQRAANFQSRIMGAPPAIPGYRIGLHFSPFREIGGDCYLFHSCDRDRHWLFLADAVGHGMQAARIAHSTVSALRWLLEAPDEDQALADVLVRLNGILRRDLSRGQFVTLFAAELDTRDHRLQTILAGHHPALIANARSGPILRRFGRAGAGLGLLADAAFAASLEPVDVSLECGDRLVQYTDGLSEIHGNEGEFGEHRVWAAICAGLTASTQEAADDLAANALRFGGRAQDDLSVLTLDRLATD